MANRRIDGGPASDWAYQSDLYDAAPKAPKAEPVSLPLKRVEIPGTDAVRARDEQPETPDAPGQ